MTEVGKVIDQHMKLIEDPLMLEFQSLLDELLNVDALPTWETFMELWKKNDSGPVGDAARAKLMPLLREQLMTFYQTLVHVKQLHRQWMKRIQKSRDGVVSLRAAISEAAVSVSRVASTKGDPWNPSSPCIHCGGSMSDDGIVCLDCNRHLGE